MNASKKARNSTTPTLPALPGASTPAHELLRILQPARGREVTITLPATWVKERNLQAGASVALTETSDGALHVRDLRSRPKLGGRTDIVIDPADAPEHLFRQLVGAYLGGAGEIVIRQSPRLDAESRGTVREFVRRTARLDVVGAGPDFFLLRESTESSATDFDTVLGLMTAAATEIQRGALQIWDDGHDLATPTFADSEDEVDRLTWLVERQVMRAGTFEGDGDRGVQREGVFALLVARSLERVSDHGVRILQQGALLPSGALPPEHRAAYAALHQQAFDVFSRAVALGENPEVLEANVVLDAAEAVHGHRAALMERGAGDGQSPPLPYSVAVPLSLIVESIDRIASYSADIAEAAVDRSMALRLSTSWPTEPVPSGNEAPPPEESPPEVGGDSLPD
jgi:phosphate uptake regulator